MGVHKVHGDCDTCGGTLGAFGIESAALGTQGGSSGEWSGYAKSNYREKPGGIRCQHHQSSLPIGSLCRSTKNS